VIDDLAKLREQVYSVLHDVDLYLENGQESIEDVKFFAEQLTDLGDTILKDIEQEETLYVLYNKDLGYKSDQDDWVSRTLQATKYTKKQIVPVPEGYEWLAL
jgi:hypothetical protein